jgi:ComF family protein
MLPALLGELLDLIAPLRCAACGDAYPTHPPGRRAPVLCVPCAVSLEPAMDPPAGVLVPFAHGGALARAIHAAKYGGDPSLARRLGTLLVHALGPALPDCDAVVPVPLHRRRLAERGFNQAAEIARALGRPLAHGAIRRTRDTPSQVTLGRSARLANVHAAFAPAAPRALAGRRVLVLDDVVTTGATLAEVAAAVRAAGARSVTGIALARAPLEHG